MTYHWVRPRATQPNTMIIKMSMKFELEKMCKGEATEEDMLRKFLNMKNMGMRRIQEGWVFLERGTGVCLGATKRNGNFENEDREDPRI